MDGDIELVSDGEGLVLRGDPGEIERFLEAQSLPKSRAVAPKLETLLGKAGMAVQAGGAISAGSGRWLKLTEESAAKMKELGGLTPTGVKDISYAMIGKRGDIKSWVKVAQGPTTLLNPDNISAVGAMMTQMAMQQAIDDIKEYLAIIDEKVDDVLRAQKDAVLAEMVGVGIIIDEAVTVREHTSHVSETTWSKIQGSSQTLAATQAYALRQLDALVEKVEARAKLRDLADAVENAEPKAREWLAVIARTFQLQDALAVLELDRVLDSGANDLDQHRTGLKAARQRRLDAIARTTDGLLDRLGLALGISNAKVLFHPSTAATIARSGTSATRSVVTVYELLGIESDRKPFESTNWSGAAKQLARSARDAGNDGLDSARQFSDRARDAAFDRGDRLAAAYARRSAERRSRSDDEPGPPSAE